MITTRKSIADALSTVPGIKGYAKKPKVTKAGDAWPLINELTRGPALVFQTTWRIAVTIGSDEGSAIDKFDTLIPEVTQALQEVVYVDSARPIAVPTEAGDLYGVELIARSE
ncbi:hypothetical protein [Kribbella italica]|uniref:DUF3168 domain-containing protein n=1 Tax=Kribbella italica TaxID=1540520 RepID=A0A7W9MVZ4_9ACTN|nr:hypothetical protein [Kribbella italica]MBB5837752.1 hypothetical protein [Kribbella italica]